MELKPGKTFVLSKSTKRRMASIVNPVARNEYKNQMIQAELAAAVIVKREKRPEGQARGAVAPDSAD
jgi:hypothetical protein